MALNNLGGSRCWASRWSIAAATVDCAWIESERNDHARVRASLGTKIASEPLTREEWNFDLFWHQNLKESSIE